MRILVTLSLLIASASLTAQDQPAIDFNRQIKPILSDRCFLCHGPDEGTRQADLRLDTHDGALTVIEPGDPGNSELIARILSHDDDQMPPADSKLSLNAEERDILKRWIQQGANWSGHWSFTAPIKHALPDVENQQWPTNPIDRFILAKMESEGFQPSPSAIKEKILRRLSFDLTGLPPTINELDEFLRDDNANAVEKAVDRLMSSPRYGERMTSDWLDVARYSDTYGYQVDRNRFVWPWRDWVIQAFNDNMPYDQFVTEQIAGDLLPNATDDQILATTFNRLHPQKVEGGSVEEEFRVEYVADRTQTFGMAFLGLTVECARCHDHKYDPLSQKEYYQLFSFFNNIDESGLYSYFDAEAIPTPTMLLTTPGEKEKLNKLRGEIEFAQQQIDSIRKTELPAFEKWIAENNRNGLPTRFVPDSQYTLDLESLKIARNKILEDADGKKVLELTGDDEVHIAAGDFRRHQPFTITARIWIPNDPTLLERSVIYHRSRAWTDSASRGYQLLIKNGKLSASLIHFWPGNAISVETTETVPTEKWIDVAFVYNGSSKAAGIQLFLNGRSAAVQILRDNLQKKIVGSGTDKIVIGARFRDKGFKNGKLSDFKVYHQALNGLQIRHTLKQTASGGSDPFDFANLNDKHLNDLFDWYLNQNAEFVTASQKLDRARKNLNSQIDKTREIMVMRELDTSRPAYVLKRGIYDAHGEPVSPDTPSVFPKMPAHSTNRLGLAHWLVDRHNPLTARVAVNHYWQLMFGEGLVRTPEDFGNQGQPPTHPKLLDWLAVDFQEHGWDIRRLLKQIALSNTYQQSTHVSKELLKRDPDNWMLARAPSYRLSAEMIRDNTLFVSGSLVDKIGGAPVRPYELAEAFKPSKPGQGADLYRRSLYTFWQRNGPAPVMLTLDAAKRDVCQLKRERTSSPLAALVQLNNPQTVEASRLLAKRLLDAHPDNQNRLVETLFRLLTSRKPSLQETNVLLALYQQQFEYFSDEEKAAESFLHVGNTKVKTSSPAELAAWSSVANTMFNFDECVVKR